MNLKIEFDIFKKIIFSVVSFLVFCFGFSFDSLVSNLYAHYPVDYGLELRNFSGTGTISSFGASSLMYNPSNLGLNLNLHGENFGYKTVQEYESETDFSYEQALSYCHLDYKHPDYSRLKFHLIVPPVSIGMRLSLSNLSLGLFLVPMGINTEQTVDRLPFVLDYDKAVLIDYSIKRTAFNIFLGTSYKIYKLTIGAAIDFLYDKDSQRISFADTSYNGSLSVNRKGKFWGYGLGLRYDDDSFGVAFKFRGKSTRNYDSTREISGVFAALINPTTSDPVGFMPHRYGIGVYKKFETFILNLEYEFEEYKRGRYIFKRGLGTEDPSEVAYKNVHGFSLSGVEQLSSRISMSQGLSYYTGNMSEGKFKDEDDGKLGIGFGDLEAIPHWGVGLGAGMKILEKLKLQAGLRYLFGKQKVSDDTPGEGEYKFGIYMATLKVIY